MEIKRIAVFCGSNHGNDPSFITTAITLGHLLATHDIGLVYGGGHVGLMGKIADAVLEKGGEVIGIIPEFMMDKELAHPGLSELIITNNMHQRKAKMAAKADAFIAMPGGIGTLEELIEIFTWLQLRIINKPVALLNVNHYYDPLIDMFQKMVSAELLKPEHHRRLLVDDNAKQLIKRILNNNYSFEEGWYITN